MADAGTELTAEQAKAKAVNAKIIELAGTHWKGKVEALEKLLDPTCDTTNYMCDAFTKSGNTTASHPSLAMPWSRPPPLPACLPAHTGHACVCACGRCARRCVRDVRRVSGSFVEHIRVALTHAFHLVA